MDSACYTFCFIGQIVASKYRCAYSSEVMLKAVQHLPKKYTASQKFQFKRRIIDFYSVSSRIPWGRGIRVSST